MHQKSSDEFLPGQCKLCPLTIVLIILDSKGYGCIGHPFYPAITDCDAVCVLPEILDD